MPLLVQSDHKLYIAVNNKIITYNSKEGDFKTTNLPAVIVPPNLSKGQEDVLKQGCRDIVCMCVSRDRKFLVVSTQNKQVVTFTTDTLEVLNNTSLNRVASKIRFTPDNDVLIADKTGDAYVHKLIGDEEPILVLGHLSMLLDISMTDCGNYIVTSDRDEKIRVSHYPNAYNILSYCLGHREFVTNVEFCGNRLVSASGDGTIRFWDYKSGKEAGLINTNDAVKEKDIIEKFCDKMDEDKVEVKALPVTDMQICSIGDKQYIAVSLLNLNYLQIYVVNFADDQLCFYLLQNVVLTGKALAFSLSNKLYVLTQNMVFLYEFDGREYVSTQDDMLHKLWDECDLVFSSAADEDVSVLYKRKFDNVQEYLERKRLRLENK